MDNELINHLLRNVEAVNASDVLLESNASTVDGVIEECGDLLQFPDEFVESLFSRSRRLGSVMGDGFAVLHMEEEQRAQNRKNKIVFLRLAESIEWEDALVDCVVGVATTTKDHAEVMAAVSNILLDDHNRFMLRMSNNVDEIVGVLNNAQM